MLQIERKWNQVKPNLQVEVVLLKDSRVKRSRRTFSSQGSKVCQVEVNVVKHDTPKVYLWLVSEIILLFHGRN